MATEGHVCARPRPRLLAKLGKRALKKRRAALLPLVTAWPPGSRPSTRSSSWSWDAAGDAAGDMVAGRERASISTVGASSE